MLITEDGQSDFTTNYFLTVPLSLNVILVQLKKLIKAINELTKQTNKQKTTNCQLQQNLPQRWKNKKKTLDGKKVNTTQKQAYKSILNTHKEQKEK